MVSKNDRLALVIGATGGIGGAVAERLLAGGWRVRALNRDPESARKNSDRPGLEWVKGDAMVEAGLQHRRHLDEFPQDSRLGGRGEIGHL